MSKPATFAGFLIIMAERLSKGIRKHLRRELSKARRSGDPNKIAQAEANAATLRESKRGSARYSLEWFDEIYEKIIRRRNLLIIQGKTAEADKFYSQLKDDFDKKLREHNKRGYYYDSPVGIDLTTRREIFRLGWIEKKVDGNEDTVKFFNQ